MHAKHATILIERLLLQCHVGVPVEERKAAQTIVVDIEVELGEAPDRDHLDDTADYAAIAEALRALAGGGREWVLLETLAADVAVVCLADPRAVRVMVTLKKHGIIRACAAVGVRMVFVKGERS